MPIWYYLYTYYILFTNQLYSNIPLVINILNWMIVICTQNKQNWKIVRIKSFISSKKLQILILLKYKHFITYHVFSDKKYTTKLEESE